MWKKKTWSQIEWREFHLWRLATFYISSPALSDNQCHISAWKVMNKVLAVALAVRYSRWAECACVSARVRIAFWCVFSVPYEVRARRGWVMSYSLRETDGDAGVYISTVCVWVRLSARVPSTCLQYFMSVCSMVHVYHLSPSDCTACVEKHIPHFKSLEGTRRLTRTSQFGIVPWWQLLFLVQPDASNACC